MTLPNVGEDVEQPEFSNTLGESLNWLSNFGEGLGHCVVLEARMYLKDDWNMSKSHRHSLYKGILTAQNIISGSEEIRYDIITQ